MRKLLFGAVALLAAAMASASPASAGDWYLHAGNIPCGIFPDRCSLMSGYMNDSGQYQIAYSQPTPTLLEAGVGPGTVLVTGNIINGFFFGRAARFHRIGRTLCQLWYPVRGVVTSGASFTLSGAAPEFSRYDCAGIPGSYDPEQSVLSFFFTGHAQPNAVGANMQFR